MLDLGSDIFCVKQSLDWGRHSTSLDLFSDSVKSFLSPEVGSRQDAYQLPTWLSPSWPRVRVGVSSVLIEPTASYRNNSGRFDSMNSFRVKGTELPRWEQHFSQKNPSLITSLSLACLRMWCFLGTTIVFHMEILVTSSCC